MAQNYIQDGDHMPYVVPAATTITSGQLVTIGELVGIALGSGVTGDTVQICLEGVFSVAKASGAVTQGAKLYHDPATGNVTTTAGSLKLAGYAFAPAASGDATVLVNLLG